MLGTEKACDTRAYARVYARREIPQNQIYRLTDIQHQMSDLRLLDR